VLRSGSYMLTSDGRGVFGSLRAVWNYGTDYEVWSTPRLWFEIFGLFFWNLSYEALYQLTGTLCVTSRVFSFSPSLLFTLLFCPCFSWYFLG
jgi:hypothetical protein